MAGISRALDRNEVPMRGQISRSNWEARLLDHRVVKTRSCWLWRGSLDSNGYGKVRWRGKHLGAHRTIFQILRRVVPAGKVLDHLCRVRNCVNPKHLRITTPRGNTLAGVGIAAKNAKKKKCIYGHAFTKRNTYSDPGTWFRRCRKCITRRTTEWRRRKNTA